MFPEQYRAIREGAGLVDRATRGHIVVTGPDRADYLQGLLTNDVAGLGTGTGCYSLYLTPQGRMIADLEVFNLGEMILLDVHQDVKDTLVDRFEALVFSEDVEIADWSQSWTSCGVHGRSALEVAAAALAELAGDVASVSALQGLREHQCHSVSVQGGIVVVARTDELGEFGLDLYFERDHAESLHMALVEAGGTRVDQETADVVRVESGRPAFPVDMDQETIPIEAGVEDRAISFTKGCYVGQEVIIRILHRGQGRVGRKLVGLTLGDGTAPDLGPRVPARGAELRVSDEVVGRVTSSVFSPVLGKVDRTRLSSPRPRRTGDPSAGVPAKRSRGRACYPTAFRAVSG